MEITYLNLMQQTPRIGAEQNAGVDEATITELEKRAGVSLPQAYREFLFIGGREANMLGDMDGGFYKREPNRPYYIDEQQLLAANELKAVGYTQIDKPFWVIADLDGCEQFHFFFLNEGDNPPVYMYCSYMPQHDDNERPQHIKIHHSFTDYIEHLIKHRRAVGY